MLENQTTKQHSRSRIVSSPSALKQLILLLLICQSYCFNHPYPVRNSSMTKMNGSSSSSSSSSDESLPSMIVFDLDDCLWTPEMHELYNAPTVPIKGNLNPSSSSGEETKKEEGVVGMGVPRVGQIVRLYEGARQTLRELALNPKYKDITLAVASSSLEPSYSYICLQGIEILPGLTLQDMITYHQIGRSGKLSPRKTTHFQQLHEESGIPYNEMLFFDDCNWGDHCSDVTNTFGVVSMKTPRGLQFKEFQNALKKYSDNVQSRQTITITTTTTTNTT